MEELCFNLEERFSLSTEGSHSGQRLLSIAGILLQLVYLCPKISCFCGSYIISSGNHRNHSSNIDQGKEGIQVDVNLAFILKREIFVL